MTATNLPRRCACVMMLAATVLAGCELLPVQEGSGAWSRWSLSRALSDPARPAADRERDAARKPVELVTFLGVERGMTAVDLMGAGGYLTEVLSIAVGPQGRVYVQNPPAVLQMRDGAYDKALSERLAEGRLANVVRVDADLPTAEIPAGGVDVALTALNFHDIYNRGGEDAADIFLRSVYTMLRPGGVLGVVDHAGNEGVDNTELHRIAPSVVLALAEKTGFIFEARSEALANPEDDRSLRVHDPAIRGRTDQFVLKFKRPE